MDLITAFQQLGLKTYSNRMEDPEYHNFMAKYSPTDKTDEYRRYTSYIFQRLNHHFLQVYEKEKTGKCNNKPIVYRFLSLPAISISHLQESYYKVLRHAPFSNLPSLNDEQKFNDAMAAPAPDMHILPINMDNAWNWRLSSNYRNDRRQKRPLSFRITANIKCTPEWIEKMDAFAKKYHAAYKSPVDCSESNRLDTMNVYFISSSNKPTPEMINDFCQIMRPYIRPENNDRLIGTQIEPGIHWSPEYFSEAEKNKFDYEMNLILNKILDSKDLSYVKTSGRLHFNSHASTPKDRSASEVEILFQIKDLLNYAVLEQPLRKQTRSSHLKIQQTTAQQNDSYQIMLDALFTPQISSADLIKLSKTLNFGNKINQFGHKSRSAYPMGDKGTTLLEKAIEKGEVEVASNLIQKGADKTIINKGKTLFHVAVENIDNANTMDKILQLLMSDMLYKDAINYLNRPDKNGLSPLTTAILYNNQGVVKSILRHGGHIQDSTQLKPFFDKNPHMKEQYEAYLKRNNTFAPMAFSAGNTY